ncbi:hypothetical protein LZ012_16950 [Dechloromonas sp. XY25]|uniref:Uncharacterized protein n=1 Tax=Dechloromonas hankyongensis TaxID=2908002 RepID=A0ABS9K686_9RHOO|nr:hypothetical protein [Dechloromonas hankyongensis]MCG2578689.1 hypothetical protein [Dechloromonas hankyongensis]
MNLDLGRWPINDDAESELRFWVQELFTSFKAGTAGAVLAGLLVALLYAKLGDHPMADLWPVAIELAFWLGMFAGLLWGGSKRLGIALAAGLPWHKPRNEGEERARLFGQWAAFAACIAFFLWLTAELAPSTGLPGAAALAATLQPIQTACWLAGLLFGVVALTGRLRRRQGPPSDPTRRVSPH